MNLISRTCGLLAMSVAMSAPMTRAAEVAGAPAMDTSAIAVEAAVPDTKVTLETRHLPLSQVLAAVRQQAGVELAVREGTFAREPKVTMAVAAMPLREWMESLAKLYDFTWQQKGPNTFEAQDRGLSQNDKELRHIGSWFNYWTWSLHASERPEYLQASATPDWRSLVDDNLDLEAVTTKGVPLSDAPAALQQAVRAQVQLDTAFWLLHDAVMLGAARGPLTISVNKPQGATLPATASIKSSAGSIVTDFPLGQQLRGRDLLIDPEFLGRPDAPSAQLLAEAAANRGN